MDERHDRAIEAPTAAVDIELILDEYRRRQMLEHLTGPIVSLVLHVAVLVLLFLVLQPAPSEPTTFTEPPPITWSPPKPAREFEPTPTMPPLERLPNEPGEVPAVPIPAPPPVAGPETPAPAGPIEPGEPPVAGPESGEPPVGTAIADRTSVQRLEIPASYLRRVSEQGREKGRAENGGSDATEWAVVKALRWLKAHQNENGSWSQGMPAAMTGLAVLCYLGHGELPGSSVEYGVTVQNGLAYLSSRMVEAPAILEREYSHGIATYALCEAYAMLKVPQLKIAAEKGLRVIVDGQQASGGWNYNFTKEGRWDLSVSGWQIQAVRAGFIAGLDAPGLSQAMEKSAAFLRSVSYHQGKFGYAEPGSGSDAMQGAGALCLQLLGFKDCREAKEGVKYVAKNVDVVWRDRERRDVAMHNHPCYGWYYQTQAMFHAGTTVWAKWNGMFASQLTRNQHSDGHWDAPPPAAGRKADLPEYDPYYSTTLCCLMLEIYYRNLKTYEVPKAAPVILSAGPGSGLEL